MEKINKTYLAGGICLIALIAIFFYYREPVEIISDKLIPAFINPFATTSVQAKGVFVYSPSATASSSVVLFASNENVPLPLASVTKIMTAYAASQIISENETVTITESDLWPEGDTGLNPGERWKFKDLRDVMLIASSNDAAESLRSVTDERLNEMGTTTTALELMNQIAKENGFNTLYFDSPSGLDATDGVASAYGSALDITLLMVKIMKDAPEIFEATREPVVMRGPIGGTLRDYKNTNISSNTLPGLLASKTGFTDAAGGNLVVMFDAGLGLPVVISILGSVDQDTRFDDMKELVSKSIRYLNGTYQ